MKKTKKMSVEDYITKTDKWGDLSEETFFKLIVGYARLQVKYALKAAKEKMDEEIDNAGQPNTDVILKSYPSSNIK